MFEQKRKKMVAGIWQTNGKNRFLKNNEKLLIFCELFILSFLWSNLPCGQVGWVGGGGGWVNISFVEG
jgi:hypothetical protein